MQHSAHSGSGRRQDRVPLAVGIDLRGIDPALLDASSERDQDDVVSELGFASRVVAADGLNVSIGGIAMRASFVPELGALLECSFSCPPTGELVNAQGEVVWSERCGPDQGEFGLRFVELDTKSATALRRLVAPNVLHEVKAERTRAATLVIDGLGTMVEAELKLADDSRLVLEQQLSFLQLGRGVEVSVPGRGKERGRIASVELRHTHFDVPTLVFGVLLDETPERAHAPERAQSERVQADSCATAGSRLAPLFSSPVAHEPAVETLRVSALRVPRLELSPAQREPRFEQTAEELPVSATISARMRERVSELRRQREAELLRHSASGPVPPSEDFDQELSDEDLIDELPGEPTKKARVEPNGQLVIEPAPPSPARPPLQLTSAVESAPAMCVEDAEVEPDPEPYQARAADEAHASREAHETHETHEAHASSEPVAERESQDQLEQAEDDAPDDDTVPADSGRLPSQQELSLSALRVRNLPAHLRALFRAPVARLQDLRHRLEPTLREQAEYFDLPDAKTRMLLQLARVRMFLLQGWSRVRRSTSRGAMRAPRTLRVQRSTLLGLGPADSERVEPSRRARSVAVAFAVVGVGLGVYALAPRSGADRIKLPERVAGTADQATSLAAEPAVEAELDPMDDPVDVAPTPRRKPARGSAAAAEPNRPVLSAPFGELEVPNGRVFTLRMNGPVTIVEGEARENGITVRVPGRQALDRASPIAASHSAVQRAMILNRGGFAELTLDFVPGTSPHYQVRGKDNTLEVTLERL